MKAQRWRTDLQSDDGDDVEVREPEEAHADA